MNDANVEGGRLNDLTVGLNGYLNPATRVSWNYIHADAHERGTATIFQMRFQFAF